MAGNFTSEVEVTSTISAPKLFRILVTDYHTLAPKADPAFKSIKFVEGDGGAGSIITFTYDDGTSSSSFKMKVLAIDPTNLTSTTTVLEGDLMAMFDTITHHLKITPSANGGSIYKIATEYKGKEGTTMPDDVISRIKESLKKSFKDMESYAIAHPEI